MPALSFQEEWTDKLLRGDKQQTTRPQTTRIWVGDPIVHIYNQQRRKITTKPVRQMTPIGSRTHTMKLMDGKYPAPPEMIPNDLMFQHAYYTHFLGKVKITEVYDIHPCEMNQPELEAWAMADGFPDLATARCWFEIRYGARWTQKWWTVIRWDGWMERYFEPEG